MLRLCTLAAEHARLRWRVRGAEAHHSEESRQPVYDSFASHIVLARRSAQACEDCETTLTPRQPPAQFQRLSCASGRVRKLRAGWGRSGKGGGGGGSSAIDG